MDSTSLLQDLTGVGHFTRELVDGLSERADVDLHLFAVSWRGRDLLASRAPVGATVHTRPLPARAARLAWERVPFPTVAMLTGAVDVVHGPNFVVPPGGAAAEVATIHDLTALHYPEMCTPDVLQWPVLLRRALRRGAWVHTVSEFVADEVREAFPEAGERVVAVANGTRRPAAPTLITGGAAGQALAGSARYVLAVGTVEPRKDFPTLVRAFDEVASHDPEVRLVIAGGGGMATDALDAAVAAAHHRNRIVRLGRVDDDARLALLRGAAVVAYPSRYEGFGLVPLEAMAVGTPVVATSVGAIPEVVGDAALLVPPHDPDSLAASLGRVLADPDLVQRLMVAGDDRVARFTWERTVDGLVDLYRKAATR